MGRGWPSLATQAIGKRGSPRLGARSTDPGRPGSENTPRRVASRLAEAEPTTVAGIGLARADRWECRDAADVGY